MTNVIQAVFQDSSKKYSYLTNIELEKGDYAVVECDGVSSNFGYAVVLVQSVEGLTKYQKDRATKWVVQKVNLEQHKEMLEKASLIQEIRNQLREEKEKAEEMDIYYQLAQNNPKVRELINRLADVDPNVKMIDGGNDTPSEELELTSDAIDKEDG